MQSLIGCAGKGEVWKHEKPPDNVHKADGEKGICKLQ